MNPWDKLPEEHDNAWRQFVVYRDMPWPRRVATVFHAAEHMGHTHTISTFYSYYTKFRWKERAAAYDNHIDALRLGEQEALLKQTARDVAIQHLSLIADTKELAAREVQKLLTMSRENQGAALRSAEVLKLAESIVKLDRLVHDQTTENVATSPKWDFAKLDADELRAFLELMKKATPPDQSNGT